MVEDSVESFVAQWRHAAVTVWLFPRVEGSALLECELQGRILHLFERTNPYASPVGQAKLIVHAVADSLAVTSGEASVTVLGPSRLKVQGGVLEVAGKMVVIDVGFPLVVGLLTSQAPDAAVGETVTLQTLPPLHGFVVGEKSFNVMTDGP